MVQVALVTGASSGIGEAIARRLAARGTELVLVARRRDRLEALAAELPVRAHVVPCDLATGAGDLAERVAELGVEVDLLVNNAGIGAYGPFAGGDAAWDARQVRLNCEAVVELTHAFLPRMRARRRGGVIVVASTAGMQPIPYQAVYSATKAFARTFALALAEELRGEPVRVLCVAPGPVPTEWQQVAGMGPYRVPGEVSADQVAREALAAWDAGRRHVVPGAVIRWLMRASALAPEAVKLPVTERLYRPGTLRRIARD